MKRGVYFGILCLVVPTFLSAVTMPTVTAQGDGWGTAELIERDHKGHASNPQIGIDAAGNVIAVWQQIDGGVENIRANRYVAGAGWGRAQLLETNDAGDAREVRVAVDPSGNAMAVWLQYDGVDSVWANRYVVGTGWGTAQLVETDDTGYTDWPHVAVDSSGNAAVVWQQWDGMRDNVWARRYIVGTGWGTAELIETNDVDSAALPRVAVDPSGNATAVWNQISGPFPSVWANRYVVGTGWGTPEPIETNDAGTVNTHQVAVDPGGNVTVVWEHWNGAVYDVWANRYVVGTGWGTAGPIETNDAGNAYDSQVAVDAVGNASAVWRQWDDTVPIVNIWANRYVVGTGWGTAGLIEANDAEYAHHPEIAVDPSGNAVAVFEHYTPGGPSDLWTNRYVVGTGWGTPELIGPNADAVDRPQVAVDSIGTATLIWPQSDGTRFSIWANRYVVGTGWGTLEPVEREPYDVFVPDLAVDPSGNAIAVWTQNDGTGSIISANRYVVGTGWGTPEVVEGGPGNPFGAKVAVDPSGNGVAVWYQFDGTRDNIWANRYVVGTGWGTSELIETDPGEADSPEVAVDAAGNAIVVWQQWNTAVDVWANRYVVGTGWGIAERIEVGAENAFTPQVSIDPSGNAISVWYQIDGIRQSAWANRYVVGTGWGTAELIETDDTGDTNSPSVAVDAAGNAVAVWQQWDGATFWDIWSNQYVVGTGWGTAGPIETGAASAFAPQVAVGPSGSAAAVWVQVSGPFASTWANRYVVGTGWGTAGLVETSDTGDASTPQVAVDPSGNAIATWRHWDGVTNSIWANRYVVGTGWGTAESIETGSGAAQGSVVAVDAAGNAIAVWQQFDGEFWDLWANRFTAPDTEPPVADAGPDQAVPAGTLVTFNGSGSTDNEGITNYSWTFSDGGPRTLWGVSPSYTFNAGGTFAVTLTVRDAAGNTDTDVVVITVSPPPDTTPPVADAGPDQVVTVGTPVTFDGSASTDNVGVTNYTWTFDDGGARTLWGVSPTYTFNGAGIFSVSLTVRDAAGNSDSDAVVITVNPPPPDTEPPVAVAGSDQVVTAGTVVTFDGSASTDNVGVTNYTWTFDDGGTRILYGPAPSYRFDNTGTFGVTLIAKDATGNSGYDVVLITVTLPPDTVPPVANAGPDQVVFVGTTAVLDGSGSTDNVGIVNFTWSFSDGGAQVRYTATFAHQFNSVGAVTITLTVRDAAGNTDADTVVITVNPPPDTEPPVANAGPDQFVAVGTLVTFDGSGSTDNAGVTNYTWTFDDGGARTLYGPSPTYRFDNVGAFVVILAVRDAAGNTDSDVVVVAVTPPTDTEPPVANAGLDQAVFAGTTAVLDGSASTDNVGIVNYTWSFNDGGVKFRYTSIFAYQFNNVGTVTITLAVRDAAGNSDSDSVVVTVTAPDTEPPVANAGPDQVVTAATLVTFDGSGSADNVGVTNYTWTFDDGGTRTLYGSSPTYTFNNVGAFVVILAVGDAAGNSDSDAVVVAVTSPPDTEPPVADAGPDQVVYTDETVVLDGAASTDNVGVTNYTWTFTYDGTTRTLYGPLAAFRFTVAGNYTVILAVRDAAGNSDTDAVTITSSARPGGGGTEREVVPPAAIAGIGAVAILEAALALRLMSPRRKGRAVPKKEEKSSKGRAKEEEAPVKEEEAPAKVEPEPKEDEFDL